MEEKTVFVFTLTPYGEVLDKKSKILNELFTKETVEEFSKIKGRDKKEDYLNSMQDGYVYKLHTLSKKEDYSTIILTRTKEPKVEFFKVNFISGNFLNSEKEFFENSPKELKEAIKDFMKVDGGNVRFNFRLGSAIYFLEKILNSSDFIESVLVTKIPI